MVITDSQVHIWGADLEGVMGRGVSRWLGWPEGT